MATEPAARQMFDLPEPEPRIVTEHRAFAYRCPARGEHACAENRYPHASSRGSGATLLSVGVDTEQAFGVQGGTFNISGVQLHGGNLSATKLLNLQTVSGITGDPATRLWELWYQQAFLDGNVDVKIGQQSIDQEFIVSGGSSLFLNTMTGWPMLPTADLYAGGPVYPLSSLGVRLRAPPTESLTLLAGVFNDNPPGGPFNNDSQLRGAERYGARFNLNTGALFIAEAQYAANQPVKGDTDAVSHPLGLAGIYKLGGWFDAAAFNSPRYDNTGLSLANPASTAVPAQITQNFSLYGVMDQAIWRPDPEGVQSLNIFARVMGAPSNRNLIEFSLNAGVTLKAPLPGRDDDSFGIGYGLAKVSGTAIGLDQDIAHFSGTPYPKRSSESFLEVTYQIQVNPWWQIQPDLQYFFMPSGGIPNPNFRNQRIRNEAVFGVRTNITF